MISAFLAAPGCTSRVETASVASDSTVVRAARSSGDIEAAITLCSRVSKKTGRRIGAGRLFEIEDGKRVHAVVDLENRFARGDRELSFHLVWIGPNERVTYKKRVELAPDDSTSTFSSTISLSARRRPGRYNFQVYLFRELIAEKSFELRPQS
jgi:hypothetical protein